MASGTPAARFWHEVVSIDGSATPYVIRSVLVVGLVAALICAVAQIVEQRMGVKIGVAVAPYEVAGAMLSVLIVLRTNAGYDRWWEARKLWGGIVNQSRNLAISALTYGPDDPVWRREFANWTAAFPHVARASLRGERQSLPEVRALLGDEETERIIQAEHMPGYVVLRLARLLREALDSGGMAPAAFMKTDEERARLIDHIGGCERILKTPLPPAYSIKIRQFIAAFLILLPFALLHKVGSPYLVPLITMLIAYPLLSLDRIGVELQNPFSPQRLNHLPLDDISQGIERTVLAFAQETAKKNLDSDPARR